MKNHVRNDKALQRLRAYAAKSEQWEQEDWYTETKWGITMCLATLQAIALEGCPPATNRDMYRQEGFSDCPHPHADRIVCGYAVTPVGNVKHVAEIAAGTLGLNPAEADALFHCESKEGAERAFRAIFDGAYR